MRFRALLLLALFGICFSAEESADDLQKMSSAQLTALEAETKSKVAETNTKLKELRAQTATLKLESDSISEDANKAQGAKDWETEEKHKREEELKQVKLDVESKQRNMEKLQDHVNSLKSRIDELKVSLQNLTHLKESVSKRNDAPSLLDVMDVKSESWYPLTRNVYKKTRDGVLPTLSSVSGATEAYRKRVSSSPILDLLASILLYGFFIGGIFASHRVYMRVRGQFTVARLLFLGDLFFATFWTLMLVCYCFLWTDPLVAIQSRSPNLFFFFQLGALIIYVNFVLLRVLLLASTLSLSALGETLAVVVVGHHYYIRVFSPTIMDQAIHGTLFYYVCYAWLFGAFCSARASEFAPLKQLRGPKLPPIAAARIFFARIFSNRAPDGDLESRPFIEGAEDGHEH